jgi:hypothetical protein
MRSSSHRRSRPFAADERAVLRHDPVVVTATRRERGTRVDGELSWAYPQASDPNAAVEVQYAGKIYVNDRDTDFLVGVSTYATF